MHELSIDLETYSDIDISKCGAYKYAESDNFEILLFGHSSALPYESWLKTLQKSLTGPVAFSVSIIGIVSCGATLIFSGGEISSFMRSIIYLVLVMTLLIGANSLMSSLFNGATIDAAQTDPNEYFNSIRDYVGEYDRGQHSALSDHNIIFEEQAQSRNSNC